MSYAINTTNDGWRAINSNADLLPGETFSATQPVLAISQDQVFAAGEAAIQAALDAGAKAWGYDSLVSAASYSSSTNAKFKAESLALIGWRDAVWVWAASQQAAVSSGSLQVPASAAAFIAGMPAQPARP